MRVSIKLICAWDQKSDTKSHLYIIQGIFQGICKTFPRTNALSFNQQKHNKIRSSLMAVIPHKPLHTNPNWKENPASF